MVASWSKVWKATASGSAASTSGCNLSACCNVTSPSQLTANNTLADGIPCNVETAAEAVGYWIDHIARRLAAKYTITASSDMVYDITFKRGQRTDTVKWQVGSQGRYPIIVTYNTPVDSGSASFFDVFHAVDWHVQILA